MSKIISVNGLTIKINNEILINNVSFDINEGDAILLSGLNGVGKSTLIKSIMGIDINNKTILGNIKDMNNTDILSLNSTMLQKYRSEVAYIQQRDEYSEMGNVQVKDIVSESMEAYSGRSLSYSEVNDLIDKWIPRKINGKRVFDAKSKPRKFSGGEQRLLSVFAAIATRSDTRLLLIDEPLNNLDFINVRLISNMINKVHLENPKMGLIMISHCRIFPFISRELKLSSNGIEELVDSYSCHSCFGEPDDKGFYK